MFKVGVQEENVALFFSDVTHEKEPNVVKMIDLNSPPASNSPNDSNCSTSTPVSKEEHARRHSSDFEK